MPMNEYQISLLNDAITGKKKAIKKLCVSFHDQLAAVIERELSSRVYTEIIIKSVTKKAPLEMNRIQNPVDFERMIISLTIAECANYPRAGAYQQGVGARANGFPGQNNAPAAQPSYPNMPNQRGAQPFRPVSPNNAPAAQPINPSVPNKGTAQPMKLVMRDDNSQHIQNRISRDARRSGGYPGAREPEISRERFTNEPTAFHSLNMGNSAPSGQYDPARDQNTPRKGTEPVRQSSALPIRQKPLSPPSLRINDDEKTELLDDAKLDSAIETSKTESAEEAPALASAPEQRTQPLPEAKTEKMPEEKTESLPEPKTELLNDSPVNQSDGEPRTELLPEAKTESLSGGKTEFRPESEPTGELLFKPDKTPRSPINEAPRPPVAVGTAPKVGLLVCTKGEDAGENFSLIAGRNRVGVSENCDVQIKDASLTAEYDFEIIYDDRRESFTLIPGKLSSRLFINNDYVDSPVFMQPHDVLRTGNAEFLLVSFR